MCNFASMVLTKNHVYFGTTDSHEDIIADHKAKCHTLYEDYKAKWNTLGADYLAKRKAIAGVEW